MLRGLRGLDLVGGDVVEVSPPLERIPIEKAQAAFHSPPPSSGEVAQRAGGGKLQSRRLQISDHGLQNHLWGLPPPPRMTGHLGVMAAERP